MSAFVVAAGADLFFAAKITEAGKQTGVPIELARSISDLVEKSKARAPVLVILDLNSRRFDPIAAVAALRAETDLSDLPILGFYSHVQVALRHQALAVGCTRVIPRSELSSHLPEILTTASGHDTSAS